MSFNPQVPVYNVGFVNTEWKPEWNDRPDAIYDQANYSMDWDGTMHVFDGYGNFRGDILADGTMKPNNGKNSDPLVNEMNMTFLRCAAKARPNAGNVVFPETTENE